MSMWLCFHTVRSRWHKSAVIVFPCVSCTSCNMESEWWQIHDSIIRKVSSRYSMVGSNTGTDTGTSGTRDIRRE